MGEELKKLKARGGTILRTDGGDPLELLELGEKLRRFNCFDLARRVLERARENPDQIPLPEDKRLKIVQQQALCTYKDPDLPRHTALERALSLLTVHADLEKTKDQETLGLAGAILKRQWEVDGAKQHLELSLAFYRRGYDQGVAGDQGYTGINAAYVLDLLADLEEKQALDAGATSSVADERRRRARAIRERLVDELPGLAEQPENVWLKTQWWFWATLAEAHFGLGIHDPEHYEKAGKQLTQGQELKPPDWEFESTVRQLASLAMLQAGGEDELKQSGGWEAIRDILGKDLEAVRSVFNGKLGLALSGGGFRASLFHIGVLARLAELDVLRHVHVLSCVSGGSIVGAHYYLELRRRLSEKQDGAITRDDYIGAVRDTATAFMKGVKRNLRTRVAGSIVANAKMMFSGTYSRTERLAELFEREIYDLIDDDRKRTMGDLKIFPPGRKDFEPKRENWRRKNKVPMLVLNATSLNSGHNWQFTTSFMGESPHAIDEEIDGNWRFRRLYYKDAPGPHQSVPLGVAVGASACVPGLFEPIVMRDLYPNDRKRHPEMIVRLVDGGVHDNQGVVSLLEQDCSAMIVSDASGQMTSDPEPAGGILAPLLRTNSILMERVRQAQFQELKSRHRSGLLKRLMILHLKKALDVEAIDWKGCEEPAEKPLRRPSELLPYEVMKDIQTLIAGIRTDLDSFTDIECFALMTSGYLMAHKYADELGPFAQHGAATEDWDFLQVREALKTQGSRKENRQLHAKVREHLAVAGGKAFKVWQLYRPLRVLSSILGAAAVLAFVWVCLRFPDTGLLSFPFVGYEFTVGHLGWTVLVAAISLVAGKGLASLLEARQTLRRIALGAALSVVGGVASRIHLWPFDWLFLKLGELEKK